MPGVVLAGLPLVTMAQMGLLVGIGVLPRHLPRPYGPGAGAGVRRPGEGTKECRIGSAVNIVSRANRNR